MAEKNVFPSSLRSLFASDGGRRVLKKREGGGKVAHRSGPLAAAEGEGGSRLER